MKNRWIGKAFLLPAFAAFLIGIVFLALLLGQTCREYRNSQGQEAALRERVEEREAALRANDYRLKLLQADEAAIEAAIRRRLGYAKPGELIFRFEEIEADFSTERED